MQEWELYKVGVDLEKENKVKFTGMPHDKVVYDVLYGDSDVGFVRTGVLDQMESEGKIKLSDLKIINRQPDFIFPVALSTNIYDEWPFCATKNTKTDLVEKVKSALLEIDNKSTTAQEIGIYGFGPPSVYTDTEGLMIKLKKLKNNEFSLQDAISKFDNIILSIAIALLALGVVGIYYFYRINRNLKKSALELSKLNKYEKNLLESLGEGVFGLDIQGRCTFINNSALQMLGFEKEEVIGADNYELFHYKKPDGSQYHLNECPICMSRNDGRFRAVKDVLVKKDGSFLPVEMIITPIFDEDTQIGAVVSFLDYSISQHLITSLKGSTENWKALFESNGSPLLVVDSHRNIFNVNTQFCFLFGYEKDEILGKNVRIIHIDQTHYDTWRPMFQHVSNSLLISSFEYPLLKKDSTVVWCMISGSKLLLGENETGAVWSIVDITSKKQAEETLKNMNTMLESKVTEELAKNREKDMLLMKQARFVAIGEMISNIAHQWRQPLNALGISVQDLKLSYELDELSPEYIEQFKNDAMSSINYMSDTIDNFRNFFKPDTQKEFFEVSKSIELAIGFVQNSLENKHVKIVFENKALNNTILGYTKEFSQVLLNIFNNSNDAFDKNITDNPQITIITSDEGNEVLIKVVDNGGGISDDVIEKIFDPYFTTKHKSKGTGVGLYMSKMIVESMNGSITATNTENGAIVEIRLPTQNSSNG